MANFLGVRETIQWARVAVEAPFPSGSEMDSYTWQFSQRSTTMPVRESSQTSSVTVKICTIDEAASEALRGSAWARNQSMKRTMKSRASMSCTLIGQVKGTSFRMLHGGREEPRARKSSVRGG
jgi:hypothetical protein